MGAGASLQEDVGWHALAAMAEAADKPDLVAKIVRENQIDAATALKLDDDDLRELVDRKLDFKKLQGARDELRERSRARRRHAPRVVRQRGRRLGRRRYPAARVAHSRR